MILGIVFTALTSAYADALNTPDDPGKMFELQPVDSGMTSEETLRNYMNYRCVLFTNLSSVMFAFLKYDEYPGWREELLTVHRDGDDYIAILTIPDQRLRGFTNDLSRVSIRRVGKRLPPTIAIRVENVTEQMLKRVRRQRTPVIPEWGTYYYFFCGDLEGYKDSMTPGMCPWLLTTIMENIGIYIQSSPYDESSEITESGYVKRLLTDLERLEEKLNLTPLVQEPIEEIMAQVESYRAKQGDTGQGKTPLPPYSVTVNAQNKVSMSVTNMPVPGVVRLLNAELDKLKPRPYVIHLHCVAEHDGDYNFWTNPSLVNIPADAKPLDDGAFKKLLREKIVPTITLCVEDMPIQEVIRNIIQQHPAHIYGDVRATHAHLSPNANRAANELYEWEMED